MVAKDIELQRNKVLNNMLSAFGYTKPSTNIIKTVQSQPLSKKVIIDKNGKKETKLVNNNKEPEKKNTKKNNYINNLINKHLNNSTSGQLKSFIKHSNNKKLVEFAKAELIKRNVKI